MRERIVLRCVKVVTQDDGDEESVKSLFEFQDGVYEGRLTVSAPPHTKPYAKPKEEFFMSLLNANRTLDESLAAPKRDSEDVKAKALREAWMRAGKR